MFTVRAKFKGADADRDSRWSLARVTQLRNEEEAMPSCAERFFFLWIDGSSGCASGSAVHQEGSAGGGGKGVLGQMRNPNTWSASSTTRRGMGSSSIMKIWVGW